VVLGEVGPRSARRARRGRAAPSARRPRQAIERQAAGSPEQRDHEAGDQRDFELEAGAGLVRRDDQGRPRLDEDDRHHEVDRHRDGGEAGQQTRHEQQSTDQLRERDEIACGHRCRDPERVERLTTEVRRARVNQLLPAVGGHDEADDDAAGEQPDARRGVRTDARIGARAGGRVSFEVVSSRVNRGVRVAAICSGLPRRSPDMRLPGAS
jgi:hypothetical protein